MEPNLFNYERRYWYPHLKPADIAIWERFIDKFPEAYSAVEYDAPVGKVPEFVAEHDDPAMKAQGTLYQRKIDVVGYRDKVVDIIELKPAASSSAIGQVNGYRHLYMRDISKGFKPGALIITDRLLPEMEELCAAADVRIIAV